eukprot:TRINITY_DN44528_c1_g2_i2.p1 TRINITY_DN44528_c1_g2~~TRINITY_DN44528_c1_g2_i2.p1  ORF type:complete len:513 (-),score=80.66 TRINITY_DN44528_c1_g2_i2:956-2347(-)
MARFTNMVLLPLITLILVIMALTNILFIMPDATQTQVQQSQNDVRSLIEKKDGDRKVPIDLRTLSAKEVVEPSRAQSYDVPNDLQNSINVKNQFVKDDIEDDPTNIKTFNKWDQINAQEGQQSTKTFSVDVQKIDQPTDSDLEMHSKKETKEELGIISPATQIKQAENSNQQNIQPELPKQNPLGREELLEGGWRLTPSQLHAVSSLPNAEVVSWQSPHAIILRQVLTQEECKYLMDLAGPALTRSKVVAQADKQTSQARTSFGAFLNGQYRDQKVEEIEHRIHDLLKIPYEFGESLYVLRYQNEQKYDPHMDYCARAGQVAREECQKFLKRAGGPECGEEKGGATCGDRLVTAIVYLSKATKGGETIFPKANGQTYSDPIQACHNDNSLKVAPNAGDIIMFWNYVPKVSDEEALRYPRTGSYEVGDTDTEAVPDPSAVHGACPVEEGEKWVVTRWIRSATFK